MDYDTGDSLILVKTALDGVRDNTLLRPTNNGKARATDPDIFTQMTLDRAAYVSSVLGGGGYFSKTVTGVAQDITIGKQVTKNAFPPKTTIAAEFKFDIPISRRFMIDQQHSVVEKSVTQATMAWEASRDKNAFQFFAYGFGTTLSTTIGDSVALFSNTHVNASGDTVDNYETTAMSDSGLNNSVVSLRAQKSQFGVIIGWEPDFIACGNSLHHDANIVSKSVLKAGSGSNDQNYFSEMYPGARVAWNAQIDNSGATSQSTMYFVGAKNHGVVRFQREAMFSTLVPWETDVEDLYRYKIRASEEVDTIEYTGLVGNDGTA